MFKVGDRVRYTGLGSSGVCTGSMGTVEGLKYDNMVVVYWDKFGYAGGAWVPRVLEKIIDEKDRERREGMLTFDKLQSGKTYRLLHQGEKDHGYEYELRSGKLYNLSKDRWSNVPFDLSTRFLISNTETKKYKSLSYDVVMRDGEVKVGCQKLAVDDALLLAHDLILRYSK